MQAGIAGLIVVAGTCLGAPAVGQDAAPRDPKDSPPYVFAGIRYGTPFEEAVRLFGKPESIDDATASTRLSWAGGKVEVSYYESTGLINGFTVTGREGAQAVLRVAQEPMLRLLAWTKEEVLRIMGPPAQVWYEDTRHMWRYEVDKRTAGSIFLECTGGLQEPCDELQVHWSGTTTWDPNDGVDALGLRTDPICDVSDDAVQIIAKQLPTGVKASNDKWDMEIYENAANGSWSLMGASRTKEFASWKRCTLAKGSGARGYVDTPWYREYFSK